jgi:hypothetical protein
MMHLPSEINLGANVIPIQRSDDVGDQGFGDAQIHPHPLIRLHPSLDGQQEAMTVLHELVEIIDMSFELNLTETQVRCIEQGLAAAMRQTPELLPYFQDRLQGR